MTRFADMPFDLTGPIIKNFSGHPYAYMEIKGQNIFVARKELEKLNNLLLNSNVIPSSLSKFLQINPQKMILKGTRMINPSVLICTPYDLTGKPSKTPLAFLFISEGGCGKLKWNGKIYYSGTGEILKAETYFWYRKSYEVAAYGWSVNYQYSGGALKVWQVAKNDTGMPETLYMAPELQKYEHDRLVDKENYEWLQKTLPDICPKSISGYKRGKTANSPTYRKLVLEARKKGREL